MDKGLNSEINSYLDRLHLAVSDWSWEFSLILEHTLQSLAFDNLQNVLTYLYIRYMYMFSAYP